MGALASNRKRGVDYSKSSVSLSYPIDQSYVHIAKKPKLSVSIHQHTAENNRQASSNSVASRISLYPEKSGSSREVHAPVRKSRFGLFSFAKCTEASASSRESPAEKMGISFFWRWLFYKKAKDSATKTSRFTGNQKGKEVIEIDSDDDVVEKKRKGGQGAVDNLHELNAKTVNRELRSLDSSAITDVSNAIAKVDGGEENRLSMLDQVLDDDWVRPYKKHYNNAKKRDGKLADIDFEIEIAEKSLKGLHLLQRQKKDVLIKKDAAVECFVPLTEDEEAEVSRALSNISRRKLLVTHENSNLDITGEKLQCLRPGAWLNDEVINLYLELLKERERRELGKFLKCHFFNTFFYKKLISGRGYNFQSVRRWTTRKKLGYSLLECDKIFVPIHKEIHWCLAVINKKDEKFQYLDSLGGVDNQVLNVLARYYVDEVKDKCGKDINVSSWAKEFVEELPEQENGYDCGVFMIKYADFYSRDIGLCFSQENMPYFRKRTAKEILRLRAD